METKTGITLAHYPDRLSEGDLDRLANAIGKTKIATSAPAFSVWLLRWINAEGARRDANAIAEIPAEATQPTFNAARWSNDELADALQASRVLTDAMQSRPECSEFVAQIHRIICAWAATRLRSKSGGG